MDPDDAQVVYSVRELLDQIKTEQTRGFTQIAESMAGKADKADVARLEARLDHHAKTLDGHSTDIGELQQWRRDREVAADVHQQHNQRTWTFRQKAWAAAGTITLAVATVAGPLLANHMH